MKSEQRSAVTPQWRLGIQLHAFSNMVSSTFYQRTEVPFGISLPEWRVLQEVIASPGASQGEVAAAHGLNVMTVSRAVSGLVRKGLVDALTDPTDRRRRLLEATQLGIEIGVDIAERASLMYGHIFDALSHEELETLDVLIGKVNDVLRQRNFPELPDASRDWADVLREVAAGEASAKGVGS